jgi:protein phosphatase
MGFSIGIVCSTGVGAARGGRESNEDNYLICNARQIAYRDGDAERVEKGSGEGVLLAVCDGMGGGDHGDVAATAAVRVLAKLYRPGVPREPSRALLKYIQESHRRLYWRARDRGPVNMGTTMTVAWMLNGKVTWTQVGDSRLYLYRAGRLIQVSADQTRNEFARRDGLAPVQDGDRLAQNFIYGSRGLGDNTGLRLELGLDAGAESLQRGDRLLLCTDGLWGWVDDVSVADVLKNTPDPQAAAVACMERAIARGSTDNITVMVVRVDQLNSDSTTSEVWEDDDEETFMY